MTNFLRTSAGYLWIILWGFWIVSSLNTKSSVKRQSLLSRFPQNIPVLTAFFLLFGRGMWPEWLRQYVLPKSALPLVAIGWLITAIGLGFAIWARIWIGSNWSSNVTIKEHHELIQRGPYEIVRHPIYAGLLLAFLGTSIIYAELSGFVGFTLIAMGFGLKMRLEESFMIEQFGNTYREYKRRVKAVIPYLV